MTDMNVISVDVGSGSVRVALSCFKSQPGGESLVKVLSSASKVTTTNNPAPEWYEQSSSEIWSNVVECIKKCLTEAKVTQVSGIGFTATCSLVVVNGRIDGGAKNKTSDDICNYEGSNDIIMWMDHRAMNEASAISSTGDQLLNQVGGICSPEFSLAKLLWLKNNDKSRYESAIGFMELPDYLTWKCLIDSKYSDSDNMKKYVPSNCSVTCKWFYDANENKWSDRLMNKIGLADLLGDNCKRIGGPTPALPGSFLGYMSDQVKTSLGIDLSCQVSVSSSIIDAHAGVLAMLVIDANSRKDKSDNIAIEDIFCSITGTSSCHMVSSKVRKELAGIWGPYYNVILRDYHVHEPGQSATGKLLEHIVRTFSKLEDKYKNMSTTDIYKSLNEEVKNRKQNNIKNKLLINPDFHGNRSPLADPTIRGAIHGLTLEEPVLAEIYEAAIQSLIYETKFIIESLNFPSKVPKAILVSGGLLKNPLFMETYADVLGVPVIGIELPDIDMMLTGSSLLARQAILKTNGMKLEEMTKITFKGLKLQSYKPDERTKNYHDKKYLAYREMMRSAVKITNMLNNI